MRFYYKVTLNDENRKALGRRTILLESSKQYDGDTLSGLAVDSEGRYVEKAVAGGYSRELVVLASSDVTKVQPMRMNNHYGTLEPDLT